MIKQFLKGKIPVVIIVGLLFSMLVALVIITVRHYAYTEPFFEQSMFLDGEYSVDDGEWMHFDPNRPITDRFRTIRFRGRLTEDSQLLPLINISSKNVWFSVETAAGAVICDHVPLTLDEHIAKAIAEMPGTMSREEIREYRESLRSTIPMELLQPDTPGYHTTVFRSYNPYTDPNPDPEETLDITGDLVVTVWSPSGIKGERFKDCFQIYYSLESGQYARLFREVQPGILIFFVVLLFGIVFFPVAGFIQGRIDYKYITFGVLCFFWSLYMIVESLSGYLNLWIMDSVACLYLVRISGYLFVISLLMYLRSNLKGPRLRMAAVLICLIFTMVVLVTGVLQMTGTISALETGIQMNYLIAAVILALILMLLSEVKKGENVLIFLISWGPLALSILLGMILRACGIETVEFFMYGIAFSMVYQIIRLIRDLRKQYLEAIRYQKLQKELYEAEVAVMVSQIQPHFMYNALSSIAMLCKVNPDTAYDATIAFTEYLRGNMDSLKQKEPVPFEKELEHLKKYLFIEQLRFGKKLNVEYDLQATDFLVPQLSVQPLVENAVKHGVGQKKKGGTVTIATKETKDGYEIVISDDGAGFDTNAPKKDDGRSHVGMENTRRRLKEMINAEVVIESTLGEGTTARVIIPRQQKSPAENE